MKKNLAAVSKSNCPRTLLEKLASENINCRVSSLAVAQIDFPCKSVTGALRVLPHYYNTGEEIGKVVEVG